MQISHITKVFTRTSSTSYINKVSSATSHVRSFTTNALMKMEEPVPYYEMQRYKEFKQLTPTYNHYSLYANLIKQAELLYQSNTRNNLEIIQTNRVLEETAKHPDPENGGKAFIRATINGKKELRLPTLEEIKTAPMISVAGKDSSQTKKDCSAIAGIAETLAGANSPEEYWKKLHGRKPLLYLSLSTTPTLDRYASEGHYAYARGEKYTHLEAEHFARTLLLPRYLDENGQLITDTKLITPLVGYSYSAGGKQWLAYIQALENLMVEKGLKEIEAQKLISQTIYLIGIAMMPDINALKMSPVSSFFVVSIFDGGTRAQLEDYKRLLGNPDINQKVKNEGIAFINVNTNEGMNKHRIAIVSDLEVTPSTFFGHNPKSYAKEILKHPLLSKVYELFLSHGANQAKQTLFEIMDNQSINYDQLNINDQRDAFGNTTWETEIKNNFFFQLKREFLEKEKQKGHSLG